MQNQPPATELTRSKSAYDCDDAIVYYVATAKNLLVHSIVVPLEQNGKWSNVIPFQYNSAEFSVGHPAISEDGSTLYFVSDMPGGFGGTDIYVTRKHALGWSTPENLGPEINTEGNEMFPFLQENRTLYFASNGHTGLGGLDIFMYDLKNLQVTNVGVPINSSKDDFGLIVSENGKQGFFSSNRDDINGSDNIYQFKYFGDEISSVKVIVGDETVNEPED